MAKMKNISRKIEKSKENLYFIRKKFKLVIFTGYSCNNNCLFCVNANRRHIPPKTTEELLKEIYLAKGKKIDILELIGGEATIRDDFFKLISTAKKLKIPERIIATNGRMFSDINFARKAIEAGLNVIIFSVHGPNSEIHDKLTQAPGSWEQLNQGIKNLRKLGFKNINGNTTVVKQNMKYLLDIAKFYVKNKIRFVEFIFVDPNVGGAFNNFYELVPKISIASKYMKQALDYGLKHGYDRWKVRYVPLCYFKDYLNQISELNEIALFHTAHLAPDFVDENVSKSRQLGARRKTERCKGCKLYNLCEGLWIEYLKHYGDSELKPVKRIKKIKIEYK